VDVYTYDLDEPDFIRDLIALKGRVRVFCDTSKEHVGKHREVKVRKLLEEKLGANNVRTGHFKRFAHNKVVIQKHHGKAQSVLAGSANFSIRGYYVQANNVMRFDYDGIADLYEQAFEQGFQDPSRKGFIKNSVSKQWFDFQHEAGLPSLSVSFAPHSKASTSLAMPASDIKAAHSSVLFAVMGISGGGDVLSQLRSLGKRKDIFSYGISQTGKSIEFFNPSSPLHKKSALFAALDKLVPAPFKKEWRGGKSQTVHHKFVVVDFNSSNPVVYAGSSNLAAGGETDNGDNLLVFRDATIATRYAVEAIRLVDHYHFRMALQNAKKAKPLQLQGPNPEDGKYWWKPYYDKKDGRYNERLLLSK
jgi:phosphatidylserine/phosphatidylglycerophosphate/cardiolipin synthase-like enzyme